MLHKLKIHGVFLQRLINGEKTFEVRINDRDYQIGDDVEFSVEGGEKYVEETAPLFRINYIHSGLGMREDYVVLGVHEWPPHA